MLDKYFTAEWNDNGVDLLSDEESLELRSGIYAQTGIVIKARFSRIKTAMAAAASLILVFCMGWLLVANKETSQQIVKANVVTPVAKQWMVRSNLTAKEMNLILEDASVLKLQPYAVIKYISFKGENKRDVCLSGEAFFKVAKDKTKPFTVFAGGVATTAVGTAFSVSEKNGRITVKLYEGKVRIQAAAKLPGWKKKELYLLPGEEFTYDKGTELFEVKAIPKAIHRMPVEKMYAVTESTSKEPVMTTTANWYMFNNQSLSNVFNQLEEIYNVKIAYRNADVKNVYFIGRFEKTDSLGDILKNIALLKKLHITHTGNKYVIARKP